jgi:hypothetical protein
MFRPTLARTNLLVNLYKPYSFAKLERTREIEQCDWLTEPSQV